jgi:16S rRNA (guanine1207-N2)-methyltransferase
MSLNLIVPYTDIRKFIVKLGKEQIEVVSKPGLPEWEHVSPSVQLFAEFAKIGPTDSVLLYGSHQGALGVYLARKLTQAQLSIADHNGTMLELTQRTLSANNISSVSILTDIDLPEKLYQKFDASFIQIPKGRSLARRWLLQAYNALVNGGYLYLAGSNNSGIQSVIKDAQRLFGSGRILAYKKGNRIAQFIKTPPDESKPDWVHAPGIAPHSWVEFTIPLSNHTYLIRSLPGVFSSDHLDEGTQMLLSVTHIPPGAKVLDVGCGYGIIGLYAAVHGATLVHLIDNNLLAVAACRETLILNGINNAEVFSGDLLNPIGLIKYDLILSNPPFHTGHGVDYQIAKAMIGQSYQALIPGGQLIIVANRFIRYDHLIKEIFGNISVLAESGKFHVLSGLKSSLEIIAMIRET